MWREDPPPPPTKPAAEKIIVFAADGMRPDLLERYARERAMPTFDNLLHRDAVGENGLIQAFPPNTGVGWYALATGTGPGEHGSTNNTFHRTGEAFTARTSFATTGILQADTLLQAAERAGKKVASVEWVGARTLVPPLQGPVVDYRSFFSMRGVLVNYDLPGQPAGALAFGLAYERVDLQPASGWANAPSSFSLPMETVLVLTSAATAVNPHRSYNVLIYGSTDDGATNYDRVIFPQVSGLCFTYDVGAPVGSRVISAVRQAADGSCTGPAVDFSAAATYTIAMNDFMASGGDGYPVLIDRAVTRELMDQVVEAYIQANSPVAPAIQGRIVGTGRVVRQ
ncbi:MAG: alkaline phosphatase family protein [Thermoflexus sp.]|uniref:alkaline phosphatase family protein n=1 Tax=Thermoflexus sp. TaxID=1969742 RepID=UPI0025D5ADDC|nr:alkaline phosphatase family protein [Thermoflexus sp.]MCS6964337.1 alkaline phosphatase family protein [Thermoflexus sp.]